MKEILKSLSLFKKGWDSSSVYGIEIWNRNLWKKAAPPLVPWIQNSDRAVLLLVIAKSEFWIRRTGKWIELIKSVAYRRSVWMDINRDSYAKHSYESRRRPPDGSVCSPEREFSNSPPLPGFPFSLPSWSFGLEFLPYVAISPPSALSTCPEKSTWIGESLLFWKYPRKAG